MIKQKDENLLYVSEIEEAVNGCLNAGDFFSILLDPCLRNVRARLWCDDSHAMVDRDGVKSGLYSGRDHK